MIHPSTFSIVAYSPEENAWGVAVASKFLAVGSVVPWARANAGAVATQSYANTTFGQYGLDLMEAGGSAEAVLNRLLAHDPDRDQRQVGLVDQRGDAVTFTGQACYDWAGGQTGPGFAAQGNILASGQVVHAMAEAFSASPSLLPWRLYKALLAGQRAGGDRRGRQSAALLAVKPQGGYGGMNDRWVDLRVDDHPDPVSRLGELLRLHDLYFGKSPQSEEVQLMGEPLIKLQELLTRLGYYHGPLHGEYDAASRAALEAFISNENFEDRIHFATGRIDRPVLDYMLEHYKNIA
jgi:uncharacterized Ntn-hydrolase superfamily protein